jgi:hypothetical protein
MSKSFFMTLTITATMCIEAHDDVVRHAEYSPDASMLATASHDKTVIIWDTNVCTAKQLQVVGVDKTTQAGSYECCGSPRVASASSAVVELHWESHSHLGHAGTPHRAGLIPCRRANLSLRCVVEVSASRGPQTLNTLCVVKRLRTVDTLAFKVWMARFWGLTTRRELIDGLVDSLWSILTVRWCCVIRTLPRNTASIC